MQAQIRPAAAADVPEIAALEQQIFGSHAWSEAAVYEEVAGQHRDYFVAEIAGKIAGYAGVLTLGGEADVQTIALAESSRGHGLGRQLLLELGTAATERGAKQIFLEVRADNPTAIALYQKFGFTQIAVREKYYQPGGIDAVIMRAPLPFAENAQI
ncbi:MAG: ribosomal protein S18-alanine N-acetyltransferase, partial [Microbacteriaceae bacterium]|nr:ribosomal protein S18-alanine N-acetyltransferase [Microbacteriaceae bacterium]